MSTNCGCCACLAGEGPLHDLANRPGLSTLHYRIGTHGTFFDAMIRRLTVPVDGVTANYSLHALTTRETDDPAIAFLDAWATVGDVLTFYQERIANEGFLRTALERRSILELGRLVGYKLKPGVSASVYLSYTIDATARTIIPARTKSQSIPGPGEQPQIFETSEDFEARGEWNAILPRLSMPQEITLENVLTIPFVWIKGTSKRIDPGDPLLFVFTGATNPVYAIRRVLKTELDTEKDRTTITLEPVRLYYTSLYQHVNTLLSSGTFKEDEEPPPASPSKKTAKKKAAEKAEKAQTLPPTSRLDGITIPAALALLRDEILLGTTRNDLQIFVRVFEKVPELADAIKQQETIGHVVPQSRCRPIAVNQIVKQLSARAALAPASEWQFGRTLGASLAETSDYLPRLVSSFLPRTASALYTSLSQYCVPPPRGLATFESLHVLHRHTAVFGYNAPTVVFEEPPHDDNDAVKRPMEPQNVGEANTVVHLDSPVESLARGTYVVARRVEEIGLPAFRLTTVGKAIEVENLSRSAYTVSTKTTRLTLDNEWATFKSVGKIEDMIDNLKIIRTAAILTESEELELAQRPITRHVGAKLNQNDPSDESATRIHLDNVLEGFKPGRWVIVTGEQTSTADASGIISAELAMVANVELKTATAGGTSYSVLVLAGDEGLKYRYKRPTVAIYGNIVKADNGATFNEILGAGNAATPLQTFTLHQKPLTFVSAPTPDGIASTLAVRVNDVLWHETDAFLGSEPTDRIYITKIADDGTVSVIFGNGVEGSRVPTGTDNVRARYRAGIGKPGNVKPKQIATAIDRPLGVKDVVNPLGASGGADPESRDDARKNIPVSLQAMGRVVSVQDFSDFARTFGGINKAVAVPLTDGRRRIVHLTIGGTGDIEIDVNSDLYRNVNEALRKFGDPYQPFFVSPREQIVIAGSANVRVHPDYLWANVGPKVRAKLLDVFSYDRREFGQVVFPAEVTAAIQSVEGVQYVDLDLLGPITREDLVDLADSTKPGGFGVPDIAGIEAIVPKPGRLTPDGRDFLGAQIAYLPPALADLFVLTEITNEP